MDLIYYIALIVLIAAVPLLESFVAIPFGVIVGVPTITVVISAIIGNVITVILLIRFVDIVWEYLRKRKIRKEENARLKNFATSDADDESDEYDYKKDENNKNAFDSKRMKKAKNLWDKYGLSGLTIIGTGLLSSHFTALVACLLGGNRFYITMWMIISITLWSALLGGALHFGIDIFS